MTTTVIVLVNGPQYKATVTVKDKNGAPVHAAQVCRAGRFIQAQIGADHTIEVAEAPVQDVD
jgi:hypothetical protein